MGTIQRSVCHLNIIGYRAAVAAVKDPGLKGRPYVISGASGGRALVLDLSPEAIKADIQPGMPLSLAERKLKDLMVLPPDLPAYGAMNTELERIAAVYAPAFENDQQGNLYLDLTGTAGLFGPAADCASHLLREMYEQTGIRPAAAVSENKLVCKVATRTIRPVGMIQIQGGTEEAFLAHQDIRLLPGMGPSLLRTVRATGFREIGDLASLSDGEALALFGKRGPLLRDTAKGIDTSPVHAGNMHDRSIEKQLDFGENVIDFEVIRGGLFFLSECAGLEMRGSKWGVGTIQLQAVYADGVGVTGEERVKRPLIIDKEIGETAERIYLKMVGRRIRIRSITLTLKDLRPLGWEPDLFLPEEDTRQRKLQEAADTVRTRYGLGALTKGAVLTASMRGSANSMQDYHDRYLPFAAR